MVHLYYRLCPLILVLINGLHGASEHQAPSSSEGGFFLAAAEESRLVPEEDGHGGAPLRVLVLMPGMGADLDGMPSHAGPDVPGTDFMLLGVGDDASSSASGDPQQRARSGSAGSGSAGSPRSVCSASGSGSAGSPRSPRDWENGSGSGRGSPTAMFSESGSEGRESEDDEWEGSKELPEVLDVGGAEEVLKYSYAFPRGGEGGGMFTEYAPTFGQREQKNPKELTGNLLLKALQQGCDQFLVFARSGQQESKGEGGAEPPRAPVTRQHCEWDYLHTYARSRDNETKRRQCHLLEGDEKHDCYTEAVEAAVEAGRAGQPLLDAINEQNRLLYIASEKEPTSVKAVAELLRSQSYQIVISASKGCSMLSSALAKVAKLPDAERWLPKMALFLSAAETGVANVALVNTDEILETARQRSDMQFIFTDHDAARPTQAVIQDVHNLGRRLSASNDPNLLSRMWTYAVKSTRLVLGEDAEGRGHAVETQNDRLEEPWFRGLVPLKQYANSVSPFSLGEHHDGRFSLFAWQHLANDPRTVARPFFEGARLVSDQKNTLMAAGLFALGLGVPPAIQFDTKEQVSQQLVESLASDFFAVLDGGVGKKIAECPHDTEVFLKNHAESADGRRHGWRVLDVCSHIRTKRRNEAADSTGSGGGTPLSVGGTNIDIQTKAVEGALGADFVDVPREEWDKLLEVNDGHNFLMQQIVNPLEQIGAVVTRVVFPKATVVADQHGVVVSGEMAVLPPSVERGMTVENFVDTEKWTTVEEDQQEHPLPSAADVRTNIPPYSQPEVLRGHGFFFHGTSAKSVVPIFKQGLRVQIGDKSSRFGRGAYTSEDVRVGALYADQWILVGSFPNAASGREIPSDRLFHGNEEDLFDDGELSPPSRLFPKTKDLFVGTFSFTPSRKVSALRRLLVEVDPSRRSYGGNDEETPRTSTVGRWLSRLGSSAAQEFLELLPRSVVGYDPLLSGDRDEVEEGWLARAAEVGTRRTFGVVGGDPARHGGQAAIGDEDPMPAGDVADSEVEVVDSEPATLLVTRVPGLPLHDWEGEGGEEEREEQLARAAKALDDVADRVWSDLLRSLFVEKGRLNNNLDDREVLEVVEAMQLEDALKTAIPVMVEEGFEVSVSIRRKLGLQTRRVKWRRKLRSKLSLFLGVSDPYYVVDLTSSEQINAFKVLENHALFPDCTRAAERSQTGRWPWMREDLPLWHSLEQTRCIPLKYLILNRRSKNFEFHFAIQVSRNQHNEHAQEVRKYTKSVAIQNLFGKL